MKVVGNKWMSKSVSKVEKLAELTCEMLLACSDC